MDRHYPDPVIVIPGITATYLTDRYPLPPEAVWKVLFNDYTRIALHPDNLHYEAVEPARLQPDQIYEISYKELIEELRHNLREREDEPVPVFPFGYDWRMPLEDVEPQLDRFIDEVIDRTKLLRHYHQDGYGNAPKVNLVAHSMGGVAVAGMLSSNTYKPGRINKIVTLATPFGGSFEAVIKLATGTANLGTSAPSSREREAARLTPALYYLIPAFKTGLDVDPAFPQSLFDIGVWSPAIVQTIGEFIRLHGINPDNGANQANQIFATLLRQAKNHYEQIARLKDLSQVGLSNDQWLAVVGVDSVTRVALRIVSRQQDGSTVPDFDFQSLDRANGWGSAVLTDRIKTGDGTVPYEGAIPPFLNERNLVCVTPDDYGYWELQDRAVTKLAGFHGILPNMNMLHRMIVRFFKDLDDPHGNTWGHPAPGIDISEWAPPLKLQSK